jgi:alpha-1,2-mannosyltransferase
VSAMLAHWRERLSGGSGGVGGDGLREAALRLLPPVVFIGIPAFVLAGLLITLSSGHHTFPPFWDFHTFRDAGKDALNGRSPYPPPDPSVLIHEKSFVYPAPAAVVMVPFALLPFTLSAWLFSLVSIASVPASLRIVGVRDYRCYGVALLSVPFVNSLGLGAISPMLLVGVALVWRYRDRAWIAALALAAVVMLKLFLWPLVLWLAFTRRLRAALLSVLVMAAVTTASWAVLGFAGLRTYSHVLSILTHLVEGKGYSLVALGLSLGATSPVARTLPWIVGGVLLVLIAVRARKPGNDALTFVIAIGAALAFSPIIWLHYFVLLFIPIGIVRPRFSWLWALPLTLWVCRGQSIDGAVWDHVRKRSDLALSARIGSAGLIIFALSVASAVLLISAHLASEKAEQ